MHRLAFKPNYETDELAVGLALATAVHVLPALVVALKLALPSAPHAAEEPFVGRPAIAATLLRLGKQADPTKLPDRIVPLKRSAPSRETLASRDDPAKKRPHVDAGAPARADDSDLARLIAQSDPYAEKTSRGDVLGASSGSPSGTETDPDRLRVGDAYLLELNDWFHDRWQIPTVITQGEADRLCVGFQVSIDKRMRLWHLRKEPTRRSGNQLFDESAHEMLQKLLEDGTPFPEPPIDVGALYRGRTLNLMFSGNVHGDVARCK